MPLRSATSPPLKKLRWREPRNVDVAEYRRDCGSSFIHYAIFTGHFFHFIARHPPPPWCTNWRCNWFCRRMPSTKAAALAKASVNKVVFHSTNAQFVIGQAEAGGHQDHFAGIATGISASSNSGQFSSLSRKRRYSQREIRWRYCAGHPVPAAYFCGFNRKIQFAQRSRRKMP